MALKDVLVHVENPASSASRLAVAAHLAQRHAARLTGLRGIRHLYPGEEEVVAAR
jgi:hypothetical protein